MRVMRQIGHRIISCLALVGYLSATMVVSLFHDHHDHAAHRPSTACGTTEQVAGLSSAGYCCHHGHRHADAPRAGEGRASGRDGHGSGEREERAPLHDHDCSVCQFLAVKSLAAPPSALVACSVLAVDVRPATASAPVSPSLRLPNSRAPPRIG